MKADLNELMKKAAEMQEKMQKMQEELAQAEVTGQSGAGLVSVVMTGRHDVRTVNIYDSLMSEDKEVLVSLQDGRYGETHVLEDGEETTLHAYDDRVISVKERVKQSPE